MIDQSRADGPRHRRPGPFHVILLCSSSDRSESNRHEGPRQTRSLDISRLAFRAPGRGTRAPHGTPELRRALVSRGHGLRNLRFRQPGAVRDGPPVRGERHREHLCPRRRRGGRRPRHAQQLLRRSLRSGARRLAHPAGGRVPRAPLRQAGGGDAGLSRCHGRRRAHDPDTGAEYRPRRPRPEHAGARPRPDQGRASLQCDARAYRARGRSSARIAGCASSRKFASPPRRRGRAASPPRCCRSTCPCPTTATTG